MQVVVHDAAIENEATPGFLLVMRGSEHEPSKLKFFRSALDRCERIPILRALTGVSMLKAYRKPI